MQQVRWWVLLVAGLAMLLGLPLVGVHDSVAAAPYTVHSVSVTDLSTQPPSRWGTKPPEKVAQGTELSVRIDLEMYVLGPSDRIRVSTQLEKPLFETTPTGRQKSRIIETTLADMGGSKTSYIELPRDFGRGLIEWTGKVPTGIKEGTEFGVSVDFYSPKAFNPYGVTYYQGQIADPTFGADIKSAAKHPIAIELEKGPLTTEVQQALEEGNIVRAAFLSENRGGGGGWFWFGLALAVALLYLVRLLNAKWVCWVFFVMKEKVGK